MVSKKNEMEQKASLGQTGKSVRVKHCANAYRLPEGLPEGATVKIIRFDHGYYDVEHQGRVFHINMTCIVRESGN